MKRIWKHVGVTLATAALTSAIGSACADNNPTIFIQQVLEPPQPSDGQCLYTDDPTSPILNSGKVDLFFGDVSTYSPVLLVGNQILTTDNAQQIEVETSTVIVSGAITRITDLAGNDLLGMLAAMAAAGDPIAKETGSQIVNSKTLPTPINPFSTAETTNLPPATGSTPSYGILQTTIVDADTLTVLLHYYENLYNAKQNLGPLLLQNFELLTYTRIVGTTLGGDPVESPEFEFPVTVTFGGLVSNLARDPTSGQYCVIEVTGSTSSLVCTAGYDQSSPGGGIPGEVGQCITTDSGAIIAPTPSTQDAGL